MGLVLAIIIVLMIILSYLSAPLYSLFCQVTGWTGTPARFTVSQNQNSNDIQSVISRSFNVQFDSNISPNLHWEFLPMQREIDVELGQHYLAYYKASNYTQSYSTGVATFNVTPLKLGQYFVKVDCFCFTKQSLQPGESIEMPVSFYIDPAITKDPLLNDIKTITLSYTFFPN